MQRRLRIMIMLAVLLASGLLPVGTMEAKRHGVGADANGGDGKSGLPSVIDDSAMVTVNARKAWQDDDKQAARSASKSAWPCFLDDGSGASGFRVTAIYARYGGDPPLNRKRKQKILDDLAAADQIFVNSGGSHLRFEQDPKSCEPVIYEIVAPNGSMSGIAQAATLKSYLAGQGFNASNHIYVVLSSQQSMGEFSLGAALSNDDSPGYWTDRAQAAYWPPNAHITQAGYAFNGLQHLANGKTNWSYPAVAHEIMHNLGAVNPSAPHAAGNHHCWDQYDVMCYDDGTGSHAMQQICTPLATHGYLFDCNHDDYYAPNPARGSYLDTHWNTYRSPYLSTGFQQHP